MATARLSQLNSRRMELGMSFHALAKRSGISLVAVQRILSGKHAAASFESVVAISEALGLNLCFAAQSTAHTFAEARAREKAEQLVRMVQGSSALEGHSLDAEKRSELVDKALRALMHGSRRKLWTD